MRWYSVAIPLLAVLGLVGVAFRLSLAPALGAMGYDPWLGFLNSPVPALRLASAFQMAGGALSAFGGLAAILWRRK